jgi:hypothetical protein
MNTTTPRSLRALYLTLTLLLATYMLLDTAFTRVAEARMADAMPVCGSEAAPCLLEAVIVRGEAATEAAPSARAPRMAMRPGA